MLEFYESYMMKFGNKKKEWFPSGQKATISKVHVPLVGNLV